MKLKIISDGTNWGTSVVNQETGEALDNVVGVVWEAQANDGSMSKPTCVITMFGVPVELQLDSEEVEFGDENETFQVSTGLTEEEENRIERRQDN